MTKGKEEQEIRKEVAKSLAKTSLDEFDDMMHGTEKPKVDGWKKKTRISECFGADICDEVKKAKKEALDLAEKRHEEHVELIESMAFREISLRKKEISTLKAENEKLNKIITKTLGHSHKTCIDKFNEKVIKEVSKERQRLKAEHEQRHNKFRKAMNIVSKTHLERADEVEEQKQEITKLKEKHEFALNHHRGLLDGAKKLVHIRDKEVIKLKAEHEKDHEQWVKDSGKLLREEQQKLKADFRKRLEDKIELIKSTDIPKGKIIVLSALEELKEAGRP